MFAARRSTGDARTTAADVKYAIERALLPGVPNGFVQTYLAGVDGFDEAVKAAQEDPTAARPTSAGSPRRTTRRW